MTLSQIIAALLARLFPQLSRPAAPRHYPIYRASTESPNVYQISATLQPSPDPDVTKTTVYIAVDGAAYTPIDATAGPATFNAEPTDNFSGYYTYSNAAGVESKPGPVSSVAVASLVPAPAAPTAPLTFAITGTTPDPAPKT